MTVIKLNYMKTLLSINEEKHAKGSLRQGLQHLIQKRF